MSLSISEPDHFESVLGSPTAQRIIQILVVWSSLSLGGIIDKTGKSKSQVHSTLKKLQEANIVYSPSRGVYTFLDTPFAQLLKDAYRVRILDLISQEIDEIFQLTKSDITTAEGKFEKIVILFSPILDESFTYQMNSLAHQFLDVLGV